MVNQTRHLGSTTIKHPEEFYTSLEEVDDFFSDIFTKDLNIH